MELSLLALIANDNVNAPENKNYKEATLRMLVLSQNFTLEKAGIIMSGDSAQLDESKTDTLFIRKDFARAFKKPLEKMHCQHNQKKGPKKICCHEHKSGNLQMEGQTPDN